MALPGSLKHESHRSHPTKLATLAIHPSLYFVTSVLREQSGDGGGGISHVPWKKPSASNGGSP